MPVQKATLKAEIKAAFIAEMNKTSASDREASLDRIAEKIADAVASAIIDGVNTAKIELANSAGPVTGTITASAV